MTALERIEAVIAARCGADPKESWTAELLAGGRQRCAQKFGEEAVETVLAGAAGSRTELIREASDTLYHLLVLLKANDVRLSEVFDELDRRRAQSGIVEKQARNKPG